MTGVSRETGEDCIAEHTPAGSTLLYTDEWQSCQDSHPAHASVSHRVHEWARDATGDDSRGHHFPTREGAGAVLQAYLLASRRVHKQTCLST